MLAIPILEREKTLELGHADDGDRNAAPENAKALPDGLAEKLGPDIRQALRHWMRRRILRALNQSEAVPMASDELTRVLPGIDLSTINYHALMLEHVGLIGIAYVPGEGGDLRRGYVSQATDNAEANVVLRATEQRGREP